MDRRSFLCAAVAGIAVSMAPKKNEQSPNSKRLSEGQKFRLRSIRDKSRMRFYAILDGR